MRVTPARRATIGTVSASRPAPSATSSRSPGSSARRALRRRASRAWDSRGSTCDFVASRRWPSAARGATHPGGAAGGRPRPTRPRANWNVRLPSGGEGERSRPAPATIRRPTRKTPSRRGRGAPSTACRSAVRRGPDRPGRARAGTPVMLAGSRGGRTCPTRTRSCDRPTRRLLVGAPWTPSARRGRRSRRTCEMLGSHVRRHSRPRRADGAESLWAVAEDGEALLGAPGYVTDSSSHPGYRPAEFLLDEVEDEDVADRSGARARLAGIRQRLTALDSGKVSGVRRSRPHGRCRLRRPAVPGCPRGSAGRRRGRGGEAGRRGLRGHDLLGLRPRRGRRGARPGAAGPGYARVSVVWIVTCRSMGFLPSQPTPGPRSARSAAPRSCGQRRAFAEAGVTVERHGPGVRLRNWQHWNFNGDRNTVGRQIWTKPSPTTESSRNTLVTRFRCSWPGSADGLWDS
ncbi:hypothetical protein SFUMM280S_06105 [Streptomyces fumanus]